ncbi:MAG: hypothetical protein M3R65_01685 [Gemmatimonadota bacterium]|nr:hypothetical protein [Gemmatimonadota bacterium]
MEKDNPFGDNGGTRVGKPDTPQRDNVNHGPLEGGGDGGNLGAGKESTGGLSQHGNPDTDDGPSSVPRERKEEHKSNYGGDRGEPKKDSGKS